MTTPDPDPTTTPGLEHGTTPPQGDTPPAEGGISGISHPEPPELRRAWGPWPAVLIVVIAVVFALILIGSIIALTI
ncbi:DUF6480 family protein [Kitasatospora sp. RB6PN24]|uniref:DUF6480 family protein n=1 Tax=Kitasatospora humi TaxID=2893891 RepID=UPI001E2D3C94|nr:DUF6480 family protein [Kitasatospora humi]MCC9305901.1 DUF6480 family protein [Kitasatospora humi]